MGDAATAEHHFRLSLAIAERLASTDPSNANFQRDLSISHERLGELAMRTGDTTTAERHFRTGLAIRERLAAADPSNVAYQRDLNVNRKRLDDMAELQRPSSNGGQGDAEVPGSSNSRVLPQIDQENTLVQWSDEAREGTQR